MSGHCANMNYLVRCAVVRAVACAGMVAAVGWADVAAAQTAGTFLITFDGVVTPQHPTMTVGLWATWTDPQQGYVFGGGNYDFEAGDGEFVSGVNILNGPGSTIGVLSGSSATGAANGQLHLPWNFGIWGNDDNPILLATYEWRATDFTPRTIVFETRNTTFFHVTEYWYSATTHLFPHQFTPGRNFYVIPAPASLALIALGGIFALRGERVR